MKFLKSKKFRWIVDSVVVAVAAVVAYSLVGWLGIGFLGVFGLFVTMRSELGDGIAVNSLDHDTDSVRLLAQTRLARDRMTPEEKAKAKAAEQARSRLRYLVNTFWIAMAFLGFGMLLSP